MKKIINAVDQVENQMIEGMVKAFPQYVKKLDCGNVVVRAEKKTGKVALISGGGSGHEPAHGGFVGKGMLDAAVAGAYLLLLLLIRFMKELKPLTMARAF